MSNIPPSYGSPANQEPSKTSAMAITSLVLGLLSFLTCLLTGLPAIGTGIVGLVNISNSEGRLHGRGLAIAGIVTGSIGSVFTIIGMVLIGLLVPAFQSAREAGTQAVSMNNMRNIALAMLAYKDQEGHFPDRASLSADGKPLLSWRVYVLPYLGEANLYKQFHLDEEWDSPHNRTLLDLMPQFFASPSHTSNTDTLYLAPYGPGTIYAGPKAKAALAGAAGPSNTIMLVEADPGRAVPWTRPDDLAMHDDSSVGLGHSRNGKFIAAMADGSVHSLPASRAKKNLRTPSRSTKK